MSASSGLGITCRNATLYTGQPALASGPFCPSNIALYCRQMTDAERIEALLHILDETRTENRDENEKLVVLGFAERRERVGSGRRMQGGT